MLFIANQRLSMLVIARSNTFHELSVFNGSFFLPTHKMSIGINNQFMQYIKVHSLIKAVLIVCFAAGFGGSHCCSNKSKTHTGGLNQFKAGGGSVLTSYCTV